MSDEPQDEVAKAIEAITAPPVRTREYHAAIRRQLCAMVADGMTRSSACKALGINTSQVTTWIKKNEEFAAEWRQARDAQITILADELLEIADAPMKDVVDVARAKLRIDTRKWLLARWKPREYGDRAQVDLTQVQGVVLLPSLDPKDGKQVNQVGLKQLANPDGQKQNG